MSLIILWIAKAIQAISRKRGHGGSALPGLFVEKVSKKFLGRYLGKIPKGIIVVSGTNGKTTTTKLIVEALQDRGVKVFTNRTGSNMTRGLISAVIAQSDIFGRLPYEIAILEIDEAYAAIFAESVPVRGAVILNVMRDQLDRFGEIDSTSKLLSRLTGSAREFVVLNYSDSRVKNMPSGPGVSRVSYGYGEKVKKIIIAEDNWHTKKNDVKPDHADALLVSSSRGNCKINFNGRELEFKASINGAHNHSNLTAAYLVLDKLGLFRADDEIVSALSKVAPAFGRGECVTAGESSLYIQLVKNPSSFDQTVKASSLDNYDSVSVLINDAYADSRDVSWLWDVDFSKFREAKKIIAGGARAYDLAVRLKHEDVGVDKIIMDEGDFADNLVEQKGEHLIFCTYTAMLKIRKHLVSNGYAEKII